MIKKWIAVLLLLCSLCALVSCENDETTTTATTAHGENVSYPDYVAMTAEQQLAFIYGFSTIEGFLEWYDNEKTKYDEQNPGQDIGDGEIDLGELLKPKT